MTYETIFSRSFGRREQKKLGCGAFVGCLIFVLSICTVFKPYLGPLPVLNLRLSMDGGPKMLMIEDTNSSQRLEIGTKGRMPMCNTSEPRSDFCDIDGDIRIHGNSSTIFIASSDQIGILAENRSWTIRPYARKGDAAAMAHVRNFSIKSIVGHQEIPHCTLNHSVPAILFSIGGYSGNHFHAFSDVVIPLYLTSRQFNGEVQFLVTDKKPWWINKFWAILKNLSRYEIIYIDRVDEIHCFPSVIVGLKCHKELNIDPSKSPYSMKNFRQFLRSSYSLKRATAIKIRDGEDKRPRLLIISRRKSRSFTNEGKIAEMARNLGYDVVVAEPDIAMNLSKFAQIVNSCDALMGVHGAGLTNTVFLPDKAVLIQVVPLGGMEWMARYDFGEPSKDMNIRYLEYKIREGESSLIQQYPLDHVVFRDPNSFHKKGWGAFSSVYLDKQNVKLDVGRFRATLLEALELLHQ